MQSGPVWIFALNSIIVITQAKQSVQGTVWRRQSATPSAVAMSAKHGALTELKPTPKYYPASSVKWAGTGDAETPKPKTNAHQDVSPEAQQRAQNAAAPRRQRLIQGRARSQQVDCQPHGRHDERHQHRAQQHHGHLKGRSYALSTHGKAANHAMHTGSCGAMATAAQSGACPWSAGCIASHMGGTMSTTSTNAASSWAHAWANKFGGAVQRAGQASMPCRQHSALSGIPSRCLTHSAYLGATMSVLTEPVHFDIGQNFYIGQNLSPYL